MIRYQGRLCLRLTDWITLVTSFAPLGCTAINAIRPYAQTLPAGMLFIISITYLVKVSTELTRKPDTISFWIQAYFGFEVPT